MTTQEQTKQEIINDLHEDTIKLLIDIKKKFSKNINISWDTAINVLVKRGLRDLNKTTTADQEINLKTASLLELFKLNGLMLREYERRQKQIKELRE